MLINVQFQDADTLLRELLMELPKDRRPAFAKRVDRIASALYHPNLDGAVICSVGCDDAHQPPGAACRLDMVRPAGATFRRKTMRCEDCKWWEKDVDPVPFGRPGSKLGSCHCVPPTLTLPLPRTFVPVFNSDWCGRFQPKDDQTAPT